jgi:hypothetical protein
MNRTSDFIFGVVAFCGILANIFGRRMTKAVRVQSGKSYWPPAANSRLAKVYRSFYGPDHTYTGYCFFNLAVVLDILVLAFYVGLHS